MVRNRHIFRNHYAILLIFCLCSHGARRWLSIKKGKLQLVVPLPASDLRDMITRVPGPRLHVSLRVSGVRRVGRGLLTHYEVFEAGKRGDDDGGGHFGSAPGVWFISLAHVRD